MHPLIIPTICLLAGIYFFVRNIRLLMDQDRLAQFLATDPRGQFWAKRIGEERMFSISKNFFLPIGLVVSFILFSIGAWSLLQLIPVYM